MADRDIVMPAGGGTAFVAPLREVVTGKFAEVVVGPQPVTVTATIAASGTLSGAIDCSMGRLAAIIIPAGWDAANLNMTASPDGVTYYDMYDALGSLYTITVGGVSRIIQLPFADFISLRYLKLKSTATQTAQRDITAVLVA